MSLDDLEKKLYGLGPEKSEKKNKGLNSEPKEAGGFQEISGEINIAKTNPDEKEKFKSAANWNDASAGINQTEQYSMFEKIGKFSKIIFILTVLALIAAGSVAGYYLSQYLKTKDFTFEVKAPNKVLAGRPFSLSINIENTSKNTMRAGVIDIQLPEGVAGLGKYSDRQVIEENIGDLKAGDSYKNDFFLAVLDISNPQKNIDVYFSYLPPNLNTKFEKKEIIQISSDQSAISLNLSAPQKVFSGEQFEIGVNYKNSSDYDFSKIKVEMVYPGGLKLGEITPAPTGSNNEWSAPMQSGYENSLVVKGSIVGPDGNFYDIKARVFAELEGKEYQLFEKTASFSIASSPLFLSIAPNNNPNYVASLGDTMSYRVGYRNNTDDNLQDVIIKIKVSGSMFDLASYQGSGFFDSVNNVVVWNASQEPSLKNLVKGAEGAVTFSFKVKNAYPIKKLSDKNFVLKASGEISSPTVPYYISSDKTVGLASVETKILGKLEIGASQTYNKKGPYPPEMNKPTRYLARWTIKNSATDVKDVKMRAVLQSGASWTGNVNANIDTDGVPTYNERTQEIIWSIGNIIANKGIVGKPIEASFDVEISPSISQVGSPLPILSDTQLTATDAFTGSQIITSAPPVLTFDIVR